MRRVNTYKLQPLVINDMWHILKYMPVAFETVFVVKETVNTMVDQIHVMLREKYETS